MKGEQGTTSDYGSCLYLWLMLVMAPIISCALLALGIIYLVQAAEENDWSATNVTLIIAFFLMSFGMCTNFIGPGCKYCFKGQCPKILFEACSREKAEPPAQLTRHDVV